MAEIATIFLSPFLQVFFERMASGEFVDFFRRRRLSDGLLKKLKTTFLLFVAVLEDAEELQVTKPVVKDWLDELKDAIYDAEDVLDEVATESLRSELDAEFQTTASKVLKPFSAFHNSFVKEIEQKIKKVLERLDDLARQKDLLGLREGIGGKSSERSTTTSLVEESDICGRNDEKEEIIKMLLLDDAKNNEMCVIAIVGMGGIGKTTLAQIVYNHDKVNEQFNLKAWVCVSEEFNVFKITKTILEAVTLSPCFVTDLNQLQLQLKECLMGKKFLLVLDDVWNEKYGEWEDLCKPFKSGALGSKVLVTTRNDSVALAMRATTMSHHLKELPEEDCWSLFAKHAFHVGNSDADGEFKVVGRKIMEKCGGLPLAVKAIGALLRSKPDVDEWNKILSNELWDLPIDEMGILPALRLSYKYLPSHIKQCFAYCSVFPKDYAFKKDQLILLWMAEGFLPQPKDKTMEEVGNEYFLNLESRSLFQKSSDDKSCFVMHDLVSDLAKSISGQFISRLEDGCSQELVNNTRHLSYFFKQDFHRLKKFETIDKAKRLRTFLHLDILGRDRACYHLSKKVVHDLLPTLRCLRLLSLSKYDNITELPDSIGKLKHLRYLDLSFTEVQRLPDSICELCNLQTLRLSHCRKLVVLPRDIWKLISLRHLDISITSIEEMPIHLGRLKCLQTLTKFIVSKGSGSCIRELGKLVNLRGPLAILKLQNVESPTDALCDKTHLEELVLHWNVETHVQESQRIVLDGLRPHTNLKILTIKYYAGKSLSDWIGLPSFSKLASLDLQYCKYCSSLPPLGQLPSLQNLSIFGFDEVVTVGGEFCGSGSSSFKPFGALKVLRFQNMKKWEKWISIGDENEGISFPQLENLEIIGCPKLTGGLPAHLPSLAKLYISKCQQLVASLSRMPALRDLWVRDCKEVLFDELPTGMQKLNIERIESLPKGLIDSNGSLQELSIVKCSSLMFLPKDGLPSTLKTLHIRDYGSLVSFPEGMIKSNDGLQELVISSCSSLVSLPKDGLPSTLKTLRINDCGSLVSFPEGMIDSNGGLQEMVIERCSSLVSFPKDGLPSTLKTLRICGCGSLVSLPEGMIKSNGSLQELVIERCSSLVSLPKDGFPSTLKSLEIHRCMKLELQTSFEYSSLEKLLLRSCDSVKSIPLDLFPNLMNIQISSCSNLESLTAPENYEHDLVTLEILEIQLCDNFVSFPKGVLRAPKLTRFVVKGCGRLRSLPDKMHILLPSLDCFIIDKCPKVESFPEGGLPSNLRAIRIPFYMRWGLQNLPFLTNIIIFGNSEDVQSFPEEQFLPTNLTFLGIWYFPNLKSLGKKGLQHLNALENLWINNCPKLNCMPEQGLPPSLSILEIDECPKLNSMPEQGLPPSLSILEIRKCPLLKKKLQSKKGKEWRKIAHVEHIEIDYEWIQ